MHDFSLGPSTSTYRARGKVKLSSSEEAREETLLTISRQALELFLLQWWCWKDLRETACDRSKTSRNLADARYFRSSMTRPNADHTVTSSFSSKHDTQRCDGTSTTRHVSIESLFCARPLASLRPARSSDYPLEMTTWARARLLTPAWHSSSGPNGPGAGSLRFTHWVCTRRICFRVSCMIGAIRILKGCHTQSLSHSVSLLPKTVHSDNQLRYKGRRSAGGHG